MLTLFAKRSGRARRELPLRRTSGRACLPFGLTLFRLSHELEASGFPTIV